MTNITYADKTKYGLKCGSKEFVFVKDKCLNSTKRENLTLATDLLSITYSAVNSVLSSLTRSSQA